MVFACDDEMIEVSVKDSGIGLLSEDQERIFNPFEQVDSDKNRKFQGTGLGLSLTRKFVELHNGFIWVQSEGENKGADFRFVLPSRQPTREQDCQPLAYTASEIGQ
jgi:signal transduction histidine kinase